MTRLGRPAHADARGPAAARVHARGHPRVLRAHRRLQAQQLRRRGAPRARGARGPERALPAGDGRRAPAPRRARELPRGRRRTRSTRPGTRRTRRRARARCRFSRVLYVDRDDFAEVPPKGWFRLSPGAEVRLRYACIIKCERVVKDDERRGRRAPLHLGSGLARRQRRRTAARSRARSTGCRTKHALPAEVRLYDRLFTAEHPGEDEATDFLDGAEPRRRSRRCAARASSRRSRAPRRRARAVRARRLLLRRPRLEARRARLQPHHRPTRLVGRQAGEVERGSRSRARARAARPLAAAARRGRGRARR